MSDTKISALPPGGNDDGSGLLPCVQGGVTKKVTVAQATNLKQDALGFTPENVANKTIDGTLGANSDTLYPSEKAVRTYADTKQPALGYTAANDALVVHQAGSENITGVKTFGANLLFTDASFDIGQSGATRPRDGFFSRDVVIGSSLLGSWLTASVAVVTDASKKFISSVTTAAELAFVSGVTSAIQTQLNARATAATTITIAGTANQVVSSAGAQDLSANRTWTLSTPQNIHTSATPQFLRLGLGAAADGTIDALIAADALGAAINTTRGLQVSNTTAAADTLQQYSPQIIWSGQGWKTNATAASQNIKCRAYLATVQGAANPTGTWTLDWSVNGVTYNNALTYTSGGSLGTSNWNISFTGNCTFPQIASGSITAANTNAFITGYKRTQTTKTGNYTVITSDYGVYFNNSGAGAGVTFSLPASVAGAFYIFAVLTAQTVTITANGSDTIRNGVTVSAGGGTAVNSTVGSVIRIFCPVAGQWFTESIIGTWVIT
jgi:hypothetical protein